MAKRLIAVTVSTLTLVVGVVFAPPLQAQAPGRGTGTFELLGSVRVIDGDTLDVDLDGHRVAVGLIGIKAPMANTLCGKTAAAYLETLVEGPLRLDEDLNQTFDTRKRRMYYLKLGSGASVAVELVRAGLVLPQGESIESAELALAAQSTSARTGCAAQPASR